MEIAYVRGQMLLEDTGVTFNLFEDEIRRLAPIAPRDDEAEHYTLLAQQLFETFATRNEDTSRQIVVANAPVPGTKLWCFTSIQLLLGRRGEDRNTMIVNMRASSTRRLRSDLGFICREAQKYNVTRVLVVLGSFHVELDPEAL